MTKYGARIGDSIDMRLLETTLPDLFYTETVPEAIE